MKEYPSIPGSAQAPRKPCLAFYKYDGSNLRFEYSKKQGWHKFGTRHQLFDKTHEVFGSAVDIFLNKYAQTIEDLRKQEFRESQSVIVFCEFFGKESFAGQHKPDDPKDLMLFDVNFHKRGIMSPRDFKDFFEGKDVAQVVYEGNLNEEFIAAVKENRLDGVTLNEGVVCKGGSGHDVWMAKIKTNQYFDKLKAVYADGWKQYWE
jgi:hypothetical protein